MSLWIAGKFVHFIALCFFGSLINLCTFLHAVSLVRWNVCVLHSLSSVRWYVCSLYCMLFLRFVSTCVHFTGCYFFGSLVRVYTLLDAISLFRWYVYTLLCAISLVRWYVCTFYSMLFLWFVGTCVHFTACYFFVLWYVCTVNCMLFLSFVGACAHFTVCYFFGSLVRVLPLQHVISTLNMRMRRVTRQPCTTLYNSSIAF